MSIVAVGLYFVPLLIVIIKKLWSQRAFRLFSLYWLISALVNVVEFLPLPRETAMFLTVVYNMFDMPMVLGIICAITASSLIKKSLKIAIPLIFVAELISFGLYGFRYEALKIAMGGSLVLMLIVLVYEIVLKLQKIKIAGADKGMLLILAALFFEYGTYVVIYIFDYFLPNVSSPTDSWLVYYLSSIIALSVAACGFLVKGVDGSVEKVAEPYQPKGMRQLGLGLRYWE